MVILSALARALFLSRLIQRRRRGRYGRYGRYGRRGRVGFFGPMPYYSGRTRRGTRVQVSGCCLPIPLALAVASAAAARALVTRR
jgi:hypothetical protein